ncbi:MAG: DMT family transporter [Deltaproteobacteria bacterium]|nr:DMT family transporter [Deltaproteobacteria bacterium]MBW2534785.1 DMT family transporter [Deltaproteobacteria bacterium]
MGDSLLFRLCVLGAAALFSTGGAAIKACALGGWQVAGLRSGVAALTLALLVPSARRGWSWRTALVGVCYAATMILFVLANKLTTAANTIFLQSTAPLYILLLAPLLLRERARLADVAAMAVIAAGLASFFVGVEPARASAPDPSTGNLLGAAAGLSWGLTLMGLRWLERTGDAGDRGEAPGAGLAAVVVGNLLAFAVALPFALPVERVGGGAPTATDWLLILYLGAIQIGLAYVLLTRGFRRVPAFEASLLILIEPTLNPVWAWLFQGEVPGGWAIGGGVLILSASVARTWWEQRRERTDAERRAPARGS